jgi:hypothetical protein
MGGPAPDPLKQPEPEPPRRTLARRQLRVLLGEMPPASPAAVAAIELPRCVARPAIGKSRTRTTGRSLTSIDERPHREQQPARAASSTSKSSWPALLDHPPHLEPLKTDEAPNVVLHPLFLLAPRSMTTQSLVRAADASSYALNPAPSARPQLRLSGFRGVGQPQDERAVRGSTTPAINDQTISFPAL